MHVAVWLSLLEYESHLTRVTIIILTENVLVRPQNLPEFEVPTPSDPLGKYTKRLKTTNNIHFHYNSLGSRIHFLDCKVPMLPWSERASGFSLE